MVRYKFIGQAFTDTTTTSPSAPTWRGFEHSYGVQLGAWMYEGMFWLLHGYSNNSRIVMGVSSFPTYELLTTTHKRNLSKGCVQWGSWVYTDSAQTEIWKRKAQSVAAPKRLLGGIFTSSYLAYPEGRASKGQLREHISLVFWADCIFSLPSHPDMLGV